MVTSAKQSGGKTVKAVVFVVGFMVFTGVLTRWLSVPSANGLGFVVWALIFYRIPPRYPVSFARYMAWTAALALLLYAVFGAWFPAS